MTVRAGLARWRWRGRGAWLWPTFVVVSGLDGLLGHALPLAGNSATLAGAVIGALVANLLAVVVLSGPLGRLVRRRRPDMPVGVARNYGGTLAVGLISAGLLAAGLAHHATIVDQQRMLRDAILRAEAFIGDRAPAAFRGNAAETDTYTIQPGVAYRTCVPDRARTRTYCVIVRPRMPANQAVVFAGYEPNSSFAAGAN